MSRMHGGRDRHARSSDTPPRLEWLLGILGIAMLVSAVSFLVHEGLTREEGPGAVTVKVIEVRPLHDAYLVRFVVRNESGEAMSQLQLVARLSDAAAEVESARALIDYLPGRATQQGGFYLRHDPRRYTLEIRPTAFLAP